MTRVKLTLAMLLTAVLIGIVSYINWPEKTADESGPALVDSRDVARLSVKLVPAVRSPVQAWVFAEGTARSSQREYLTFEATGRVTFVGPDKPGATVGEGEVLATLDNRSFAADVDAAVAQIDEAKTQFEASAADTEQARTTAILRQRQYERVEQLAQNNASSAQELEEAKAEMENAASAMAATKARSRAVASSIAVAEAKLKQAQVYLENTHIVSPIDGIVAYMNIEEGFYFTQNFVKTSSETEALQSIPFVVIDPSEYEVIVDVPSFDALRIKVGQRVIVLAGGTADQAISDILEGETHAIATTDAKLWHANAEVYSVNPAINPGGRSVQVKIRTQGNVDALRDGMFVTCWIATEESSDAIVAPPDAFLYAENEPYVFVYQPDDQTVQRRDITFGIRGLSRYEISSGVDENDMLVTDGRYKLVSGTPVQPIASTSSP